MYRDPDHPHHLYNPQRPHNDDHQVIVQQQQPPPPPPSGPLQRDPDHPHHLYVPHPYNDDHQIPLQQPPPATRPFKSRLTSGRRTSPLAWLFSAFCVLLWSLIILGGLVVLIVYLAFRPHSPRLDIPTATLNAAYLDTGTLLNADLTFLANFTNPNHKVGISFSYIQFDLYFKTTLIATQAVDGFSERRRESALRSLHMVSSEVELLPPVAEAWRQQAAAGMVKLAVRGSFRTTSVLGSFLKYSYWLHGDCDIVVGRAPGGALLARKCTTKR